jgi:hypothetical protein
MAVLPRNAVERAARCHGRGRHLDADKHAWSVLRKDKAMTSRHTTSRLLSCAIITIGAVGLSGLSFAQNASQQAGQAEPGASSIDLYIGYSAGGGYDVYARALARHMDRQIPGQPTILPKNMPGAGSLVLANWLYNVARSVA